MTPSPYPLTIRTTERQQSLEAAQDASLERVASAVARAVRAGIDAGRYEVVGGVVRIADGSRMERGPEPVSTDSGAA